MEEVMNTIVPKRVYQHFKGKLYYVHGIATHTETGEKLVIYQALYGDYGLWARPLSMFAERIDKNRPDNVTGQGYRFIEYVGEIEDKVKALIGYKEESDDNEE